LASTVNAGSSTLSRVGALTGTVIPLSSKVGILFLFRGHAPFNETSQALNRETSHSYGGFAVTQAETSTTSVGPTGTATSCKEQFM